MAPTYLTLEESSHVEFTPEQTESHSEEMDTITLGICTLRERRGEEILHPRTKNQDISLVWRVDETVVGAVVD